MCGARLRRDPRSARPPHPTLGRRRPHRTDTTSCCSVPTITGCTTAASSPSPDHPSSLTVTDSDGRTLSSGSLARPPNQTPTRRGRPTADPSANAPNGSGTTPSNPNHRPATRPSLRLRVLAVELARSERVPDRVGRASKASMRVRRDPSKTRMITAGSSISAPSAVVPLTTMLVTTPFAEYAGMSATTTRRSGISEAIMRSDDQWSAMSSPVANCR